MLDAQDYFLDLPRSLFANLFSQKLPHLGNVNENTSYCSLKKPTFATKRIYELLFF